MHVGWTLHIVGSVLVEHVGWVNFVSSAGWVELFVTCGSSLSASAVWVGQF
jgi:hypothetical protein